jgi:SAM-dependent methyltransferase
MTIDAALLDVLQCPSCRGQLSDNQSNLLCSFCGREFAVQEGIPDMTYFESRTDRDNFNRVQASHEAAVHDQTAESGYEKRIIRIYGTKTRLLARNWADRIVKLPKPVRVLDYGCGTGQLSRVLGQYCRPLFAVDISAASVRRNVADNNVLGCVANGLFLPFKNCAFDVVCLSGVLHHISDLSRAIKEISRVAKSYVFVSDIMPHSGPSLRKTGGYPGLFPKLLYASWAVLWMTNGTVRKMGGKVMAGLRSPKSANADIPSMYEKPIASETVESLFRDAGFIREHLQFWTSLHYPGDGPVKRWATMKLVNATIGTHFDFVLTRPLIGGRS